MKDNLLISKHTQTHDDRDFAHLRSEGLKYVEALSRKVWTDYNAHDPGITILEALCYAITDLGNRAQLPISDLLSVKGKDKDPHQDLPTAKQILTTAPVSESDYRKLIIDIKGVKNAFFRPYTDRRIHAFCLDKEYTTDEKPRGKLSYKDDLGEEYTKTNSFDIKGLNKILFEPDLTIQMLNENEREAQINVIKEKIKTKYHENRNLCEDLAEVKVVDFAEILVCGDIEIDSEANAEEVMAEFLFRVQQYLSPRVPRYMLAELLDRGEAMEDVFNGPILENGFIDNEDLEKANFVKCIHLSDIIRIAKETPGVKKIRNINMRECPAGDCSEMDLSEKLWTINFPENHEKVLKVKVDTSIERTNLFKDVVPMFKNDKHIRDLLFEKQLRDEQSMALTYEDLPIENGHSFDTGSYTTIQNDLPNIYGTGSNGLSLDLPEERHAKALQLKGYLLFFDQILATYFAHLQSVGALLSSDLDGISYVSGKVADVKDFDKLVNDAATYDDKLKGILQNIDNYEERKNRFLNHLIARFAEQLNDYAFLLLDESEDVNTSRLSHKSSFLKEYPQISYNRFKSFNYHCDDCEVWDTENVSGLQRRLCRLLGIKSHKRSDLAAEEVEGMFVFENILLRPEYDDPKADETFAHICMDSDCLQCPPHDPYSLRLTIVFPGWTKRFSNTYYREFAENLIRKEVPAHILTRICWIGMDQNKSESEKPKPQMVQLQELYKNWLSLKMQGKEDQSRYLKPLVDALHDLETIYPEGTLHDCTDQDEQSSSVVLGKSIIGDIKEKDSHE